MRNLETVHTISNVNIEQAAAITAAGFGRGNDGTNYADTLAHFERADIVQLLHEHKRLVAFALYRRLLWQARS